MVTMNRDTVRTALREAERERRYWDEHRDEFRRQYGDRFVAVWQDEVVATAPNLRQLREQLRESGLDSRHVWMRFIASRPRTMILWFMAPSHGYLGIDRCQSCRSFFMFRR